MDGKNDDEISNLNMNDLDVEELERRIELATILPTPECYINCGCDGFSCGCNGNGGGSGCGCDGYSSCTADDIQVTL